MRKRRILETGALSAVYTLAEFGLTIERTVVSSLGFEPDINWPDGSLSASARDVVGIVAASTAFDACFGTPEDEPLDRRPNTLLSLRITKMYTLFYSSKLFSMIPPKLLDS
jgi:hypothetical protein